MVSLLESYKDFPDWCKRLFAHAPELGLWQLRDLDPLETWTKGRTIIIGDASHAMLPTQGQGASQSIEDAVCYTVKETRKIADVVIRRLWALFSLTSVASRRRMKSQHDCGYVHLVFRGRSKFLTDPGNRRDKKASRNSYPRV
jgi:hypothetical protein